MKATSLRRLLPFALASAILLFAVSARAGPPPCGGLADVLDQLSRKYGEELMWMGVAGEGQKLAITANPDGTTWTALQIRDEQVCLAGAGKGWAVGLWVGRPAGTEG